MTKGWIILLGLLCLTTTVSAMGSLNFDLSWNVIGGGGGSLSSPSYTMGSTVGQITGLSTSTSYKLQSGYWGIFWETSTAIPDKVGVFRPSVHTFYLKNGTTTTAISWGASTDLPVTGKW